MLSARLIDTPAYYLVLGALCGAVGSRLGWRSGSRWVLPVVQAVLGGLAFAASWRVRGAVEGALAVGGWAVGASLVSVVLFRTDPERTDRLVLRAATYREAMLAWLGSGRGFASAPTLRAHATELALYLVGAVATANLLGLFLGAVLLNTMNAWVARLLDAARDRRVVALLAWNVWSMVRVAAYVALGAACAAPLAGWLGWPARAAEVRLLLVVGFVGVLADLALKLALSPVCGRALARAVDLDRLAGEPPTAPTPPSATEEVRA